MPLQLITPPQDEPVTLDEARNQLGLDLPTWDDKLELLISAARQFIEKDLRRALVTQTWELTESHFPSFGCCALEQSCARYHRSAEFQSIKLWKGALQSVTSVKYVDDGGVEQTLDPSVYSIDQVSVPGRLYLAYGMSWPSARRQWDGVRVRYVVGTADVDVPAPLKQALLLLVAQLWKFETPEVTGTIVQEVQFTYAALVGPYRIMKV